METLRTVTLRAIADARAIREAGGRMIATEPQHLPCERRRLAEIVLQHLDAADDSKPLECLAERLEPFIETALF